VGVQQRPALLIGSQWQHTNIFAAKNKIFGGKVKVVFKRETLESKVYRVSVPKCDIIL
jgi:hypothetical protein